MTFFCVKAPLIAGRDSTACSLTRQVMHQAAVASTNTGVPDARSDASFSALNFSPLIEAAAAGALIPDRSDKP